MTRIILIRIDGEWQVRAFSDHSEGEAWVKEMSEPGIEMALEAIPKAMITLRETKDEAALRLRAELDACGNMYDAGNLEGIQEQLMREVNEIFNTATAGPKNRNLN